jgi:hypothetical protein
MALYIAIQITAWSIIAFYFVDTIFEIAMCSPREKIWNRLITTGHCFNANAANNATGIFNVISDFSILARWPATAQLKQRGFSRSHSLGSFISSAS